MIDAVKRKLAQLLQRKEVSLALIFDREGRILWHAGRSVRGTNVHEGEGFARSPIQQALATGEGVESETVVDSSTGRLSSSARSLFVKSLWIRPVGAGLFLYADSGSRDAFDPAEREAFDVLAGLLAEALAEADARPPRSGGLSGTSQAIQTVRRLATRYAVEDEPVLVVGETGTGKNRVAELIHQVSGRRGPFVVVHTPSIPEELIERELFGHRRGAFTGAASDRPGLLDEARDGTLLLDEIAEVPPAIQAKLLRVVEAGSYRPVGGTREVESRVRILAATNRNLAAEVRQERFRQDLLFRLSVLRICMPPLRERREDIRVVAEENTRLLRGKSLDDAAWKLLMEHQWPGNVRELLHVLTRAGIELDGPLIGAELGGLIHCDEVGGDGAADPVEAIRRELAAGRSFWDVAWSAFLDRELNRDQMTLLLRRGFDACGGSLKALASALNIPEGDYPRFVATLHKYDIHPRRG